jgi:hypothetical protein
MPSVKFYEPFSELTFQLLLVHLSFFTSSYTNQSIQLFSCKSYLYLYSTPQYNFLKFTIEAWNYADTKHVIMHIKSYIIRIKLAPLPAFNLHYYPPSTCKIIRIQRAPISHSTSTNIRIQLAPISANNFQHYPHSTCTNIRIQRTLLSE